MRERQESARVTGSLLRYQHTKFCSQPFNLGSCKKKRMRSRLESHEEGMGFVGQGMEMKGQLPVSLCKVILPYHRHHLSWVEYSAPCGISLGEEVSSSSGLILAPTCRAYALLRCTARGSLTD